MPSDAQKYLLVEGKSDLVFFEAILSTEGLNAQVKTFTPKMLSGKANNKEGLLNNLSPVVDMMNDGRVARIGIVLDADHENLALGYSETVKRVEAKLAKHSYEMRMTTKNHHTGISFQSLEDLPDIGLFVMPGERQDGFLEDWVKKCIVDVDRPLLEKAVADTASLNAPKFKQLHAVKAELATWLSWQEHPGRGLENAIIANLLNRDSVQYSSFAKWLKITFK